MTIPLAVAGGRPAAETLRRDQIARRDNIVRTALHRLSQDSYENIKMADVAADAQVAIGTVYRYFSSKEHLFAAVFEEWQQSLRRHVGRLPLEGNSIRDRVVDLIERMLRAFQTQPQFYRLLLVLQTTDDAYAGEIYDRLGSGFNALFDSAIPEVSERQRDVVVQTMAAVINQNLSNWVMGRLTFRDAHVKINAAVDLIFLYSETQGLTSDA